MKLKKSMFLILFNLILFLSTSCSVLKDKNVSDEIQKSWLLIQNIFIENDYKLDEVRPLVITQYNDFCEQITHYFKSTQYNITTSIYADEKIVNPVLTKAELNGKIIVLKYYLNDNKEVNQTEISNLINDISYGLLSVQVMKNIANKKISTKYTLFFILILSFFSITAILLFIFVTKYEKKLHEAKEMGIYSYYAIEGIEIERKRIAMEIHDTVIQDLKFTRINTELLQINDDESKKKREESLEIISKSINELRRICYNLNPFGNLQKKNQSGWNSFISALHSLVKDFNNNNSISCVVKIDEPLICGKISNNTILNLFRIIQEALTNISKHSKATNTSILIRNNNSEKPTSIIVFIIDDGVGIHSEYYSNYHFGINNMKERAKNINSVLEIISEENDGTKIRLEIPVNE